MYGIAEVSISKSAYSRFKAKKVTKITVFVSNVVWKQALWPPSKENAPYSKENAPKLYRKSTRNMAMSSKQVFDYVRFSGDVPWELLCNVS